MKAKYCYLFLLNFLIYSIVSMENNAKDSRKINIQQLSVKNQFDKDGGGTYSCGYHAIKNGLFIFQSILENDTVSSKAKEIIKSNDIIDTFFGPDGVWRNVIAFYKHKKLAEDYLYNYLVYNLPGDKEHVYRTDTEDIIQNEYLLRLNSGRIKFNSLNNLDSSQHLYLKNILVNAVKTLVENFNYNVNSI